MKKSIALPVLGFALTTACADNDIITRNLDELPAPARTILNRQFAHTKVSYIKIDKDLFKQTTYEVRLVDGSEASFNSKGAWTEIDGKRNEVPAFFIPAEIKRQVNDLFPGEKVTKIEKDRRRYEVELSNGADFEFDLKFNLCEAD